MTSLENSTVLIGLGALFLYAIVYRRSKLFGSIGYMILGLFTMYHGSSLAATADKNITTGIGAVFLIGAIINVAYELLFGVLGKDKEGKKFKKRY